MFHHADEPYNAMEMQFSDRSQDAFQNIISIICVYINLVADIVAGRFYTLSTHSKRRIIQYIYTPPLV